MSNIFEMVVTKDPLISHVNINVGQYEPGYHRSIYGRVT